MATKLRIATFNVENLFSRARPLALADRKKAEKILTQITRLNSLIDQDIYSAEDKKEIVQLAKDLSYYIEIREDRGKLFTGKGDKMRVTAAGKDKWDGEIAFRRKSFDEFERKSTTDVITAVGADVQCVVEAEDRPTLEKFNTQTMSKAERFKYVMLIDGNDPRGIDVGLYSQHPINTLTSHVYDRDSKGTIFSRDCLEAQVSLPGGKTLHVLCNHLKSKGYGSQVANDAKRKRQAGQVASILKGYDLRKQLVVVLGDFNDTPDSKALGPLLGISDLHDVLEAKFGTDMSKRWTYKYRSQKDQIDFILVSTALLAAMKDAGVERRGLYGIKDITGEDPFKSVTSPSTAASDHCAVWADFQI